MQTDSHDDQTTPAQARIIRLVTLLLTVVLLAAACGGEGAPEPGDAQTDATAVAADDGDDLPSTDASERTDQPDAGQEPEPQPDAGPEPEPQLPVRLGDRFGWCADIQHDWDRLDEIQIQLDVMDTAYLEAVEALDAATDELDRAEAWNVLGLADEDYFRILPMLADAAEAAVTPLALSEYGREDTEVIAIRRAQDAFFAAAAPEFVELMEAALADVSYLTTRMSEPVPVDQTRILEEYNREEEYRLALFSIGDELSRLQDESFEVKKAVSNAYRGIQDAQHPGEAMGAYERFREALVPTIELFAAAVREHETGKRIVDSYHDSGGAQRTGEDTIEYSDRIRSDWIQLDLYKDGVIRIRQFNSRPYDYTSTTNDRMELRDVDRHGHDALKEVTNRLILADPAWRAFQVSLAESCQR